MGTIVVFPSQTKPRPQIKQHGGHVIYGRSPLWEREWLSHRTRLEKKETQELSRWGALCQISGATTVLVVILAEVGGRLLALMAFFFGSLNLAQYGLAMTAVGPGLVSIFCFIGACARYQKRVSQEIPVKLGKWWWVGLFSYVLMTTLLINLNRIEEEKPHKTACAAS